MAMSENEAKDFLQGRLDCMNKCDVFDCKGTDECDGCDYCYSQGNFRKQKKALETAIKALSEIQQYRAIGTVEELKHLKKYVDVINKLCFDYSAIGTVEEFKALKEKNVAKKPRFYAHNYYCTECGNLVGNNEFEWQRFLYCDNCGQKLDWD